MSVKEAEISELRDKVRVTITKDDARRIRSEVLEMRREALDAAQAAYKVRKQSLEFAERAAKLGQFLDLVIDSFEN
jgi:hypothetical protein